MTIALVSHVSASDETVSDEIISQDFTGEVISVEESPVISSNYTPSDASDLQNCINSANDGDTIILNGTYNLKDTINIDKGVTLVGVGEGALIKKDNFNFYKIRYFNITASNVVLKNLNFVDGQNQYGGAIYWGGDNGSVIDCEFKGNLVVNDGFGGAIMAAGKNFHAVDSSFINNRATKGTGGAISIHGDGAVISNCHFEDNKVDKGSAGAIALFASNCIVENCNFTNNYCTDFGGAVVAYNKANKVIRSIFRSNAVKDNGSDNKGGGAIFSDCEDFIVENCTFEYNSAPNAFGGAIYVSKHNIIRNSTFTNNKALLGNAIYGSSFSNVISNYFALAYNETEGDAVHVAELTEFNNTFEIVKEDSSVTFISAGMVFEYLTSGSIYITVEGGTVVRENISVVDHKEAKISFEDNVLVVSGLAVGNYTLRVITTPDEAHNSVESELPIIVKKATAVISASKVTVALKRGTLWTIKLIDSNSKKPISNMAIKLKVYTNGKYKTVTLKTNSKGVASYQTKNLAKGYHKVVVSATHAGYNFNTLTSSISVIKPTQVTFKVKSATKKDGSRLSITVYNKATKKQINGVKVKLLIYTGKTYKTVTLKSKTHNGYKGVCGYGANIFSVGTHKVVIKPVDIKYDGSASSKMVIKKSAKKIPAWSKKITG
ncbi:right-handed parallel beta-helix repeat-containing protein [uncultured Methanobrevibacter sp.]|uniref:right-handed parallel beta-helix repeat-containing protein n=1 Tax=uncultured Methanobrevibacter sp. TaxID=253161 RepID=UPI002616251A|nr:right-handed parallel beta-helix repeat-containing protein [uncultured Methanobrevibacter sp.]